MPYKIEVIIENCDPAAKKLIGNRPAYNVAISFIKAGRRNPITSLGKGNATFSIAYTPGKNEAGGWLFGVYTDAGGGAVPVPGSVFDANSGSLILNVNHFSIYGVGCMAPAEKYARIAAHMKFDLILSKVLNWAESHGI